jgi:hypothetical protein
MGSLAGQKGKCGGPAIPTAGRAVGLTYQHDNDLWWCQADDVSEHSIGIIGFDDTFGIGLYRPAL